MGEVITWEKIDNLVGRVEQTYLIAKDILMGTQIADWIVDLEASGASSATYQDAARMNTLIANTDAANNSNVAKYLVQWAVENNKYGTYVGGACGPVNGVDWSALGTPSAVMGNVTAFTVLCGNVVAFSASLESRTCRQQMWANINLLEEIIKNATALSNLKVSCNLVVTYQKSDVKWFVSKIIARGNRAPSVKITRYGGTIVSVDIPRGGSHDVDYFATDVESMDGINYVEANFYVIDFS